MLVIVAGRVLTAGHHHDIVVPLLGLVRNDVSFALLRYYMTDITLTRLDVIRHLVRFVTVVAVFEYRLTDPFVVKCVIDTLRVDKTAVDVHPDILGCQLHRFVFEFTLPVQVRVTVLGHDHRVRRLIEYRCLQITLFLRRSTVHLYPRNTVRHQAVRHQTVRHQTVRGRNTVIRPRCCRAE